MIPISEPRIAKHAYTYVRECLATSWISGTSPFVKRFEKKFAALCHARHGISCTSGTTAIHLTLAALSVGPGDEVILPAFTMISTLLPVLYVGATPVLVDSEKDTGNIDVAKVKEKITKRTRAIIPVHFNGHPADMEKIMKLAKKYKLAVIEDAAEAHGALYRQDKKWIPVGSIGDMGCFSFYANKIVTTGEGGMVTTNRKDLRDRLMSLRNLARTPYKHFLHQEIAFNYRMGGLPAALGIAQLEQAAWAIQKKRKIAQLYTRLLSPNQFLTLPVQKSYAKNIYWQFAIVLHPKSPISRDALAKRLADKGIETRNFFIPLHRQPLARKMGLFHKERYPVADYLGKYGLNLPSGLTITEKQIRFICKTIHENLSPIHRKR